MEAQKKNFRFYATSKDQVEVGSIVEIIVKSFQSKIALVLEVNEMKEMPLFNSRGTQYEITGVVQIVDLTFFEGSELSRGIVCEI